MPQCEPEPAPKGVVPAEPVDACPVDWPSLAVLLGERSDRPLILLDRAGRIRLFNSAMEALLGWRRFEMIGRLWAEACVPSDLAPAVRYYMDEAFRGATTTCETQAIARDGRRLRLVLDLMLVGRDEAQSLLATVRTARPVESSAIDRRGHDMDYEISTALIDFGTLRRVVHIGADVQAALTVGQRCFDALHGRQSPCADCPALPQPGRPWPHITVRRSRPQSFEVIYAMALDENTARITVRALSEAALSAVLQARIMELGDKAQLSGREQAVLAYLVMGRSLKDIATILGISVRTVKFHQANILEKLGADSRVDLMRLIL